MNTTNLFVELIVIGVGAAGWIAFLAMAALGYDARTLSILLTSPAAAIPALVLVYLLGIVTDRLADSVIHSLRSQRKQREYFATEAEMLRARGIVLNGSTYFSTQFDYSRSRQRICRGWIVNATLLAFSLNVFLFSHPGAVTTARMLSLVVTPALLLLAAGCWLSWEKLVDTEMRRLRDQAELLQQLDGRVRIPRKMD